MYSNGLYVIIIGLFTRCKYYRVVILAYYKNSRKFDSVESTTRCGK